MPRIVGPVGSTRKRWSLKGLGECKRLFEDAAPLAIALLAKSDDPNLRTQASTLRNPLDVWLDLMRDNQRGFKRATSRPPHWRQVNTLVELDEPLSSLIGVSLSGIEHLFEESSRFIELLAKREEVTLELELPAAEVSATLPTSVAIDQLSATTDGSPKDHKTRLGRNIDRLRKECGWSYDDLAKATDLDKKLILGHVNDGKGAYPKTLETYARTFTEKMGRPVTVAELEG